MRPGKTQISLGIRPVWSECSLCPRWLAEDPRFLHADSKDSSDWMDAQADLSLRWSHSSFCWFCHVAAQMYSHLLPKVQKTLSCCYTVYFMVPWPEFPLLSGACSCFSMLLARVEYKKLIRFFFSLISWKPKKWQDHHSSKKCLILIIDLC